MSGTEKLQKAVALTITAGYQLNREAFEFLSVAAASEDPTEIMNKALQKIGNLEEKPLFIDKGFLEQLLLESEPQKEIVTQPPEQPTKETSTQEPQMTEAKKPFRPFAKDIEPDFKVIEDPTTKLSTNGTIGDYLEYFRDRFKRIEKLLRQRMDVKAAASIIDALKAAPNSKLKIICMVTEKRESKQRTILTVEDLQANITVLVPQNAPEEVKKNARSLLLDQVVCLSVTKTRGTLLIAEDIIFPDVAQKIPHRAQEPIYAVLTSDLHVGSTKFNREAFSRFVLWLNGKYGNEQMRETAAHVKYVLIAGDIVDGIGIYPNQVKELAFKDIHKQYRYAAKYIEQIPDYIEVVIIPGNHDAPRKAAPQPALSKEYLETLQESRNVYSLGNPCTIGIHGVEVLMDHGRSLDDIMATVPGMDYKHPEKAMKLLLQGRHLAPVYGGKTMLSPESRDFLVIERAPDIFHAGHVHVLGYTNYRGVSIINSGGWQEQTGYMQRMGLMPTVGQVPVVNLQTLEATVTPFA
jgi:DNA polymerase II small subunit